jgi:hypothetical protein
MIVCTNMYESMYKCLVEVITLTISLQTWLMWSSTIVSRSANMDNVRGTKSESCEAVHGNMPAYDSERSCMYACQYFVVSNI